MIYNNGTTYDSVMFGEDDQPEFDRTEEEFAEEMQKELSDDAPWKRIQQNTFTRWANEHLKLVNRTIQNLQYDLSDGLNLIALIEVLSQKKLPKHNRRPGFKSQKLENVSVALDFLENVEKIKLVNIDASHIVDGRLKLILGLIWTLILHYSISLPTWESVPVDDERPGREPTPKQKLMGWVKNMLPPDLPITNFTTDWNDGKAIGALVDACVPGLYPDWADNDPKDALKNARDAMDLAEEWLGIPQLIRPEEMIDPKVDECSMMTYLSQYPSAKLKPGAPLRPKTNASRVKCYGKGIEPTGNNVDAPAKFFVETYQAGKGKLDVIVLNPKGQSEKCDISPLNDKNCTYACTYYPTTEGQYKVIVKYDGKEVPDSPFSPYIEGNVGNAGLCRTYGPGLEPGVTVDNPTWFEVDSSQAGNGVVEVIVVDPKGRKDSVPVAVKNINPAKTRCEYVPREPGPYAINVFFAGKPVPDSPFHVDVIPSCDARKCRAYGRGIQPTGVRTGDVADFRVITKDAGDGILKTSVIGPDLYEVPCRANKTTNNTYDCGYVPQQPGPHKINVMYGGTHIPKSPFNVMVEPYKDSRIKAYGPGLEGGMVGQPADFVVDTNGETGSLGFSIEGPSQAKIECNDNGDGSANVRYWPTAPGEYAVHILCNDEDIPGSPHMAWIEPQGNFNPSKVRAYGPGLEPTGQIIGKPTEFTVDTHLAGEAPLSISGIDEDYQPIDIQARNNGNGTYTCRYTPLNPVKHTIMINYGSVAIPNSPFRITPSEAANPSRVKVYGPGVERGVKTDVPTYFIVNCKDAGPASTLGDVSVSLTDPRNRDVPLSISDNHDGTFIIRYCAEIPGTHVVSVIFGDDEIPISPIKVNVETDFDVHKIKVDDLNPNPVVGKPSHFLLNTQNAGKISPNAVKAKVLTPSGATTDAAVTTNPRGFDVSFDVPEPGTYNIQPEVHSLPLTPVQVNAVEAVDAGKVRAYGPGLSQGTVNKVAEFIVDTKGAGNGQLGVTIEGPSEAKIDYLDNHDGSCQVTYLPTAPGIYTINILYDGQHIMSSPFKPNIKSDLDVHEIRAYGPGLDPEGTSRYFECVQGVFLDSPTEFKVDAKAVTGTGKGNVDCILHSPSGKHLKCPVTNNEDGTYTVKYAPFEKGPFSLEVNYENLPIPGSPFRVNAISGSDPKRVRAYGPGLESAITNEPAQFTIETTGAGQGGLGLAIEGPSEARMVCKEHVDEHCVMEYLPTRPGLYDITIKFADKHIPGSPFSVKCTDRLDEQKVRVKIPSEPMRVNVPQEIVVDGRDAGPGSPLVNVTDSYSRKKSLPIRPRADGVYVADFTPTCEGVHKMDVSWSGKPVPDSPFSFQVLPRFEPHKVTVEGPGIESGIPASLPTHFNINTRNAGFEHLDVLIKSPESNLVYNQISDNKDGTYTIHYLPEEVGHYNVAVNYGGTSVTGSPFNVKVEPVGDSTKCRISGNGINPYVPVGEKCVIHVDARDAGPGAVTATIKSSTGIVSDVDIVDNKIGTFDIYYIPRNPGIYTIKVRFGGQDIPGGDFMVTAGKDMYRDSSNVITSKHTGTIGQYRPVDFRLPVGGQIADVTAVVTTPSNRSVIPLIEDNHDGTISIKYQPTEVGNHLLNVYYMSQPIQGSPFKFQVDQVTTGYVTAYGPGLSGGVSSEPCFFKIITKDAGIGGLAVAVEGPSKAEIQCKDNKDGTCDVTYWPTAPGDYMITVKFAEKHIPGSPFTAKIVGEAKKKSHISLGTHGEISLPVTDIDIQNLQAIITTPSGREEPCFLKRLDDSNLGISFVPKEIGDHLVSVYRDNRHIRGSPFRVHVGPSQLGDASKVKVYGRGIEKGSANVVNEFIIDTKEAGHGGLGISIEGPSKAEIECYDNEDGTCTVQYKAMEPGYYVISIKFSDRHVPGSPFTVNVSGTGASRLTERITRESKAAETSTVGSQCELSLKLPGTHDNAVIGTSPHELSAYVTSPSGFVENCQIVEMGDYNYSIKFIPKEMGTHSVSVKHKNAHIPGSPFQFTVGPIVGGGAHKVSASGTGLQRGEVNVPCEFNIYTREAGAGGLAIAVEGPAKAEIDFYDRKDGTCMVSYVCPEPGEYQVSVKFNDEHIPDSPFSVNISPPIGDAKRLTVHSLKTKGNEINKPLTFTVDFHGAKGRLDARIVAPSGAEDACLVQEMGDGEHYAIRFIPHENGVHWVHVRFNGRDIPDSPFRVVVGQTNADPGRVFASGTGLYQGETGKPCEFLINTANAGAGALAVTVDGPSKVQLDCQEVSDGYRVTFMPTAPGDYMITIKFAGISIAGSPFKCHVTGPQSSTISKSMREHSNIIFETFERNISQSNSTLRNFGPPDHTKVHASGSGLYSATCNQKSQFTVDAQSAGHNMLMVGIYGPTYPCEEVYIKHVGNNLYTVSYTVREKGSYILVVKWGDAHIPGSPFHVEVL